MSKTGTIIIRVSNEEKEKLKKKAMRHGYMSLSAFMRDKSSGVLESDEVKTLKTQNANLIKLLKDNKLNKSVIAVKQESPSAKGLKKLTDKE